MITFAAHETRALTSRHYTQAAKVCLDDLIGICADGAALVDACTLAARVCRGGGLQPLRDFGPSLGTHHHQPAATR